MSRTRKRGRLLRIALLAVLGLLVVWLVACYVVVVRPAVNDPTPVDAVVVLGPPATGSRTALGLQLSRVRHLSANLVISIPLGGNGRPVSACPASDAAVTVRCFQPDPSTTRGEAEYVRTLVQEHGWTSIIVVTSTYHISRARAIFGRCFHGRLEMVPARQGIGLKMWAYEFLYQTAAYVKASLQKGC